MGDPKDVAWMASRLREQGCEILDLKAEIERLRKLVREAYEEGYNDGYEEEMGRPGSWETSNIRKALDNAP